VTKLPILIFGSSGHASVVIDCIERQESYEIAGLVDSFKAAGAMILGYPVLGTEAELAEIARDRKVFGIVIAVGDNWQRARVAALIRAAVPELEVISAVHPGAEVARGVEIGAGSVVMAGAVINRNARIGPHCIVNTKASVDHDSSLEEFSSVAPGGTLAGNVRVGAYTAICLQAAVGEKCSIGAHSVVGAGSVVLNDLPDHVLAYGVPARVIRTRKEDEPYVR
jgi:sugar O-acyltransferase (sialic acid O-acetyltransferase NeuD family)